jgi:hypothetical protein
VLQGVRGPFLLVEVPNDPAASEMGNLQQRRCACSSFAEQRLQWAYEESLVQKTGENSFHTQPTNRDDSNDQVQSGPHGPRAEKRML